MKTRVSSDYTNDNSRKNTMQFKSHFSGSSGNLHQVISDHGTILLDPGVTMQKVKHALDFKVSTLDGALVTHSHMDHCKAVSDLMKAGIDCYMTQETANNLGIDGHRLKVVEPFKLVRFEKWSVMAFPTQHDCPGSVGFVVSDNTERLLYLTDSYYVRNRFAGLNIIAIECNYSKETMAPNLDSARKQRLFKSHFSLENVKSFLKANDLSAVREIHLVHISRDNGDPEYFKDEIQKATGKPTFAH